MIRSKNVRGHFNPTPLRNRDTHENIWSDPALATGTMPQTVSDEETGQGSSVHTSAIWNKEKTLVVRYTCTVVKHQHKGVFNQKIFDPSFEVSKWSN